jgi:hypothetical protein
MVTHVGMMLTRTGRRDFAWVSVVLSWCTNAPRMPLHGLAWSGTGTVRCKLMQPVCQATVLARSVALCEAPSSLVAQRTGDEGGGSIYPAGFELIFVVTAG